MISLVVSVHDSDDAIPALVLVGGSCSADVDDSVAVVVAVEDREYDDVIGAADTNAPYPYTALLEAFPSPEDTPVIVYIFCNSPPPAESPTTRLPPPPPLRANPADAAAAANDVSARMVKIDNIDVPSLRRPRYFRLISLLEMRVCVDWRAVAV